MDVKDLLAAIEEYVDTRTNPYCITQTPAKIKLEAALQVFAEDIIQKAREKPNTYYETRSPYDLSSKPLGTKD